MITVIAPALLNPISVEVVRHWAHWSSPMNAIGHFPSAYIATAWHTEVSNHNMKYP
jgi:hypothetical protein